MARRNIRTLIAIAGCATLVGTLSATPAQAAAPRCDIRAIKPWVYPASGVVVATNSTSCYGPVRNVRISTRLYKFHAGWVVFVFKRQVWGAVKSNRNGSLNAWGASSPAGACTRYMTQATVKWTTASGTPKSKVRYSGAVKLRASGPC